MTPDQRSAARAEPQFGLIHRLQALQDGHEDHDIRYRLRVRRWWPFFPDVYRIAGVPAIDGLQRLKGVTLWAGEALPEERLPVVAISGLSAAAIHGFTWIVPNGIQLATTARKKSPAPDIKVQARRDLDATAILSYRGIPVIEPRIALVEIACSLPMHRLKRTIEDLIRRGRVDGIEDLLETMEGRRGVGRVKQILAELDPRVALSESGLQMDVSDLLVGGGLPVPVIEYEVVLPNGIVTHIDLAYPHKRLGIETDGYDPHADKQSFEWDRYKDNLLATMGWTIVRITFEQYRRRPREVVEMVRTLYHSLPDVARAKDRG